MSRQERSDGELVTQARDGDQAAYGELVRRYERRIHRHLWNLTGSRDEALELAQEVFLKAWEALAEVQPGAPVQAWLYRIASNLAFDLLRRRKVVVFEPIEEEDPEAASGEAGPEMRLHAKQSIARLQAELDRLPADLKQVLLLREVEGLRYDEISEALGLQEGTVKSRLARARAVLAERYEKVPP